MTASNEVTVGGQTVIIQPFSPRKALLAGAIVSSIGDSWEQLFREAARFAAQLAQDNATVYNRATAMALLEHRPRPLLDSENEPIVVDGKAVMRPGALDHITEEAWERSGHELRIPERPDPAVINAYLMPKALGLFERQVARLLALAIVTNAELGKAAEEGGDEAVNRLLDDKRGLLLDQSTIGELVRLFTLTAERVQDELRADLDELGDRVGNAMRALGIDLSALTALGPEATTKPTSSSSSPTSSDGVSDGPSTASPGDEPAS
ncbi:MAG TPA: hypothetical protein VFR97_10250 [Capillimicrobium sp.]|nr:hypothetical protein [Capillimicrobium sp.]